MKLIALGRVYRYRNGFARQSIISGYAVSAKGNVRIFRINIYTVKNRIRIVRINTDMNVVFRYGIIKVRHRNCASRVVAGVNKNDFADLYFAFFFGGFFVVVTNAAADSHGSVSAAYCDDLTAVNGKFAAIASAPITASAADTCGIFTADRRNDATVDRDISAVTIFTAADTCRIFTAGRGNDAAVNNKHTLTLYSRAFIIYCDQLAHSGNVH